MFLEFPELFKVAWKNDQLAFTYEDVDIKTLNRKVEKLHNIIEATVTKKGSLFHIHTRITGSEKKGYQLHIAMTRYEKYKHKENTHKQETDL